MAVYSLPSVRSIAGLDRHTHQRGRKPRRPTRSRPQGTVSEMVSRRRAALRVAIRLRRLAFDQWLPRQGSRVHGAATVYLILVDRTMHRVDVTHLPKIVRGGYIQLAVLPAGFVLIFNAGQHSSSSDLTVPSSIGTSFSCSITPRSCARRQRRTTHFSRTYGSLWRPEQDALICRDKRVRGVRKGGRR